MLSSAHKLWLRAADPTIHISSILPSLRGTRYSAVANRGLPVTTEHLINRSERSACPSQRLHLHSMRSWACASSFLRRNPLFLDGLVSSSIFNPLTLSVRLQSMSSSAVSSRRHQPRLVLQQNIAKAARKAEESDCRFLTKEELEQVENILGYVSRSFAS